MSRARGGAGRSCPCCWSARRTRGTRWSTALVLGGAAVVSGRPAARGRPGRGHGARRPGGRRAGTTTWSTETRDAAHERPGKPLAAGAPRARHVWFAVACGVLLVVPLALGSGVTAGCAYLLSVAVALLGNVVLRRTAFSWLPWAVVVRPAAGVPVVRRVGRPGRRRPADRGDHRAGRPARRRRARPAGPPGPGRRQRRRAAPPAAAARAAHRRAPAAGGSRSW